jgi:hypothetical protein
MRAFTRCRDDFALSDSPLTAARAEPDVVAIRRRFDAVVRYDVRRTLRQTGVW